jgi:uncharacterized repeat protein (TIGR03803 family)
MTTPTPSPTLITLLNFNGTNGTDAGSGVIADAAGDLFGVTEGGGTNGDGTVFEIPKTAAGYGTPVTLVTFNGGGSNGADPVGGLYLNATGDLFGTTAGSILPSPVSGSTQGPNGNGTVFEIPRTATGYGTLTTLVTFNGTNGGNPESSLITNAAGDLFGTTYDGGPNSTDVDGQGFLSNGTVFEIPKTASGYGTPTSLDTFGDGTGIWPQTPLVTDAAGDLFGTTSSSGDATQAGTVFEIPKTATGYGTPITLAT